MGIAVGDIVALIWILIEIGVISIIAYFVIKKAVKDALKENIIIK